MFTYSSTDIHDFLAQLASNHGTEPALFGRTPGPQGDLWTSLHAVQVKELAEKVAVELHTKGLKKGDRVVLTAKSRPEYAVGFFGILLAGGVVVPLDLKLTHADQKNLITASEARFILALDSETSASAASLASEISILGLNVEDIVRFPFSPEPKINLAEVCCKNSEIAIIAYTSGTTSSPKGVMLRWESLLFQINKLAALFWREDKPFRMLSVLPLHHMFEITAGLLMPFSQGGKIYYANSLIPGQIVSFMNQFKIRNMLVVPLFLRALKKGVEGEINNSLLKRIWFYGSLIISAAIPFTAVRRILFFPLHKKFGGELTEMISGASALDLTVARFFSRIGVAIYEGYGLTETSPVISTNNRHANKPGTIGKPLEGLQVKIHSETSEILVKGPSVMVGYYKNPQATVACLSEDGWFNTGDVAEMDNENYLKIKGRNKDIIVLGSGKKVAPEEIEQHFRDIPAQEICVVGTISSEGATKGTEIVTAVVVPGPNSPLSKEEALQKMIEAARKLSYYKRPSQYIFVDEPLPKTSTLKIKKAQVKEIIKQRIIQ